MATIVDFWTDEEVDTVVALVNAGKSAREISSILGNRSRNSVLGMLNQRKGDIVIDRPTKPNVKKVEHKPQLRFKPKEIKVAIKPTPKASETAFAAMAKLFFDKANNPIKQPKMGSKTILQLKPLVGESDCRAIIGEVKGVDTKYCGEPTMHNQSWCAEHYLRYFSAGANLVKNEQHNKSD